MLLMVPAHPGSPRQRPLNGCVSVVLSVCYTMFVCADLDYLKNVRSMIPLSSQRRSDLYRTNAVVEPTITLWFIDNTSCHSHTHTRLMAHFPGLPGSSGTRKVKPIWILLKQETVSGSGISWAICKSASRSRQIDTPAPHHSVLCRPDALPATQPTASKHWRYHQCHSLYRYSVTTPDSIYSHVTNCQAEIEFFVILSKSWIA